MQTQSEPKLAEGQISIKYDAGLSVDLVCVLDYEPEEVGTRDEPGRLADATLRQAFIRDVDIYDMLMAKQVLAIETQAILDMERRISEAKAEHLIDAAIDARESAAIVRTREIGRAMGVRLQGAFL